MKVGTGWKRITETWGWGCGGPRGANAIKDWVRKDPIAMGSRSPAAPVALNPSVFHMWKRAIFSIFFGDLTFFCGWGSGFLRWQCGLPEDTCCRIQLIWKDVTPSQRSVAADGDTHPCGDVRRHEYWWTTKPSGLCYIANLFLYIHFKPYCKKKKKTGLREELGVLKAIINILDLQYVFLKALMFDKNECLGSNSFTLLFMPKICPV